MTPKITVTVDRVDLESIEPDLAEAALNLWRKQLAPCAWKDAAAMGAQVVWAYDDDSFGVALVPRSPDDKLTDAQLDFLADVDEGKVPGWRVTVSIEHPKSNTLLADDSFIVWAATEPDPKNRDLVNRAFGKYTSKAADALAWFEEVRKRIPDQPDLVELFIHYGRK